MIIEDIRNNYKLPDDIKDIIYRYKIEIDNKKTNIIINKWRKYKNYSETIINKILEYNQDIPFIPVEINNYVFNYIEIMMKYINITNKNYLNYEYIFIKLILSYYHYYEYFINFQYYDKPINEISEYLQQEILKINLKKLKIASIHIQDLGYKLLLNYNKFNINIYNNIVKGEYLNYINNKNYCNIFNDEYIDNLIVKIKSIKNIINSKII